MQNYIIPQQTHKAKCLLKDMENFTSALFGNNLTNDAQWHTIWMANKGNKIIISERQNSVFGSTSE